jgi:hypothetical protein
MATWRKMPFLIAEPKSDPRGKIWGNDGMSLTTLLSFAGPFGVAIRSADERFYKPSQVNRTTGVVELNAFDKIELHAGVRTGQNLFTAALFTVAGVSTGATRDALFQIANLINGLATHWRFAVANQILFSGRELSLLYEFQHKGVKVKADNSIIITGWGDAPPPSTVPLPPHVGGPSIPTGTNDVTDVPMLEISSRQSNGQIVLPDDYGAMTSRSMPAQTNRSDVDVESSSPKTIPMYRREDPLSHTQLPDGHRSRPNVVSGILPPDALHESGAGSEVEEDDALYNYLKSLPPIESDPVVIHFDVDQGGNVHHTVDVLPPTTSERPPDV